MPRYKSPPPKPTSRYRQKLLNEAMGYANIQVQEVEDTVAGKADASTTITAGEGLSGGGDLSANRTLALDVDSLTEDVSPVGAEDYVPTWDGSASGHKKVLLSALLEAGASELNDLDDVTISSPAHNDVLVYVANTYDFTLSGDMNAGSDELLLSGDMQSGTDALDLSGDDALDAPMWQNVPFSSLPL